jgi:peptidoglycan glycosyltransferase
MAGALAHEPVEEFAPFRPIGEPPSNREPNAPLTPTATPTPAPTPTPVTPPPPPPNAPPNVPGAPLMPGNGGDGAVTTASPDDPRVSARNEDDRPLFGRPQQPEPTPEQDCSVAACG